jgi:hypothetical protein
LLTESSARDHRRGSGSAQLRNIGRFVGNALKGGGEHEKSPVAKRSSEATSRSFSAKPAMFQVRNPWPVLAVTLVGSMLSGNTAAVVIVAAGWVFVSVLEVTLPYVRLAAPEYPRWRIQLLDVDLQRVWIHDKKRRLRARTPLPHDSREGVGSGIAPGQMSISEELHTLEREWSN